MRIRGSKFPAWALALCVALAAWGGLTDNASGRALDGPQRSMTTSLQAQRAPASFPILRLVGAGLSLLAIASQVAAWRYAR